ncbi:hypothetical protein [Streptomyces sp. N50]|uniref:hypothetical protein n=1 Tax=Streptomyces sp. N50 TaxID=3081765 RepID=UPI0029620B9A|nr:hypothetical protein [Streptomyces sp. N50]WOX09181.1 hypothetical protein R2B38_09905 [Streptomyces sp. N50]
MTVTLERLTDVPATRGMTAQHSLVDPYDEPHAVIGLRVVVSRDLLAAAVDMGVNRYYKAGERHPDDLTVEEVRYFAEAYLLSESALDLQQGAEAMAEMAEPDFYDRRTHILVLAMYRAVDRAYPKVVGS